VRLMRSRWPVWLVLSAVVVVALVALWALNRPAPVQEEEAAAPEADRQVEWEVETILGGLEVPWDLAVLPNDDLLITERPGRVRLWDGEQLTTVAEIDVVAVGEGGLMGIALHPDFNANSFVYLYSTYREGGQLRNRVERFVYENGQLRRERAILGGLSGASNHNAGRLRFGPDGKLYVLTGDAAEPSLSQDLARLEGKVLRLNADGSVPDDNPLAGSRVYSYGHRNAQGLDWHPVTGELVVSEHGQTAHDEINLILPGANYGWPQARRGLEDHEGFSAPILGSGSDTWAPSGLAFAGRQKPELENTAVFATLRGNQLFQIEIENGQVTNRQVIIQDDYGRLRAVVARGDGAFYVTTSNRDGRGRPAPNDDRLLLVRPVLR
jgi:aldose sugar dehydrogenase